MSCRLLLALAFLPYEAFFCLDAIVRTIGRMLITHRRLLEWNPSSDVDRALERARPYRPARVLSLDGDRAGDRASRRGLALSFTNPDGAGGRRPDPAAVGGVAGHRLVDQPSASRVAAPGSPPIRPVSCASWREGRGRYFETYVGPDDHWLPPDNVQEHPAIRVAHRTSPTNMGLALLANLTAHDFGYLSTGQLVDAHDERAAQHGVAGAVPGTLLQLVRHANAASRSRRCTSRRWTAATSPAIC